MTRCSTAAAWRRRSCAIAGIDIYRLQDGRLAEHWHVVDQLAMLQQLGLLPSPDSAPA